MGTEPVLHYRKEKKTRSPLYRVVPVVAIVFAVLVATMVLRKPAQRWLAARERAAQQREVIAAYENLSKSAAAAGSVLFDEIVPPATMPTQVGWSVAATSMGQPSLGFAKYRLPAWDAYLTLAHSVNFGPGWNPQGAISVVGARAAPGQFPAVAVVSVTRWGRPEQRHVDIRIQRLLPDTGSGPWFSQKESVLLLRHVAAPFRVFAAQPHPTDASVVVIPFQSGRLSGEIHARAMPDETFEFRSTAGHVAYDPRRVAPAADLFLPDRAFDREGYILYDDLTDTPAKP